MIPWACHGHCRTQAGRQTRHYRALDEAIRTTQFIRNKCVRYWQDTGGVTPYDLNKYCAVLACECAFVRKLNAMARPAAERAGAAITRFYQNCRARKPDGGPSGGGWSTCKPAR